MKDKIILPPYLHNPLHPVTIHVIGCGGTGSRVLAELVKVHIALKAREHPGLFVTAYDPDLVSSENMARQLFYEDDMGMNKAEVLITRINQNYGLNWNAVGKKFQDGVCVGANFIICCLDQAKERVDVINTIWRHKHEYCWRGDSSELFYIMDFGNGKDYGQVILSYMCKWDPEGEKKRKIYEKIMPTFDKIFTDFPTPKDEEGPSCSLAIALSRQSLFINGILAMLGINWLYEIMLKGYIDKSAIYFNMANMELSVKYIEIPPEEELPKMKSKKGRLLKPSCAYRNGG